MCIASSTGDAATSDTSRRRASIATAEDLLGPTDELSAAVTLPTPDSVEPLLS